MRLSNILGLLALGAILSACVDIHHRPEMRPVHVAKASTTVEVALTTPMVDLVKGAATKPGDQLQLGLAMLAGRENPAVHADAEMTAKIAALDERLRPRIEAYRQAHSDAKLLFVNWTKVLDLTPQDNALIDAYLRATSPDYWLGKARNASVSRTMFIYLPPSCNKCASSMIPVQQTTYLVDSDLIRTATHCVYAVHSRIETVPDYYDRLPESLRTMKALLLQNEVAGVKADIAQPDAERSWEIGDAACGTPAQLDSLVEKLKAAN